MSGPYRQPGECKAVHSFASELAKIAEDVRTKRAYDLKVDTECAMPRVRNLLRDRAAEGRISINVTEIRAELDVRLCIPTLRTLLEAEGFTWEDCPPYSTRGPYISWSRA